MRKRIICFLLACLIMTAPALADMSDYDLRASEAIIKFIKGYEGFSANAYEDSGGWAIGYGTHVDPASFPNGIDEAYADHLLRSYIQLIETKLNALEQSLPQKLTQNQYDALVSLTYNLGTGWMTGEYRLYNMLKAGVSLFPDLTVMNAFGNYSHVGSTVSERLVWRRLAEAKIFLYSDYLTGGTQNYRFEVDYNAEFHVDFKPDGALTYCAYSDLPSDQWFYRYVSPLTYSGVVEGRGDGTFDPNGVLTCGEALKLILLAAGYPAQAETGVHWAEDYYELALDEGFLVPQDMPGLDAPITRLLMAEVTARALGLTPTSYQNSPFEDTANGCVLALYDAGLVEGSENPLTGGRVYLPEDDLTRAEMCAIVWRIRNGET